MNDVFQWALTADGQVIQLFQSQMEAIRAWQKLRRRRGGITEFSVTKLKGLFDGE